MKKLRAVATGSGRAASNIKTGSLFAIALGLGSAFWLASLPLVHAAQLSPAEMLQSKLPPGTTVASATDTQLLEAVCQAIKQTPKDAALIVRTAAGARSSVRSEVLCTAVGCARQKDANSADCAWVSAIVREWIQADPNDANHLSEIALRCAPDCREVLQAAPPGEGPAKAGFSNPPSNINAAPGSLGAGGAPDTCSVCHNNQQIQISCSDLASYLRGHPGDTAGNCEATPVTNP
jgi:hypothetical protein